MPGLEKRGARSIRAQVLYASKMPAHTVPIGAKRLPGHAGLVNRAVDEVRLIGVVPGLGKKANQPMPGTMCTGSNVASALYAVKVWHPVCATETVIDDHAFRNGW